MLKQTLLSTQKLRCLFHFKSIVRQIAFQTFDIVERVAIGGVLKVKIKQIKLRFSLI